MSGFMTVLPFPDAPVSEAPQLPSASPGALPPVELSVVMPVHNEEEALPSVLEEAIEALGEADFSYEIVLLDDASTDRSLEILQAYRQRYPHLLRVLRHETNRGIAEAFRTLYRHARGRYVFCNGSDGQCSTAECLRMMRLRDRYDLIVGKRRRKQYRLVRHVVSAGFNAVPLLFFGVRTYDAGNIKLFRKDVLDIPLLSRSPFAEAERIIRARRRGFQVGAVPVEHHPRQGGKAGGARWHLITKSLIDLGRCFWAIVVRGQR
jgi:glycosyltransferase involved in cell wall biosynthesis